MKTYSAKADDIHHDWLVVDAENMTLGRLATEIAHRLRGKHKPEYTPHMDMGDYVVVVNCEKIRVTGAKQTDKMYYTTRLSRRYSLRQLRAADRSCA